MEEIPLEDTATVVSAREDDTSAMDVDEIEDAIEPRDNLSSENHVTDISSPEGKEGPYHELKQSTARPEGHSDFASTSNFYGWSSDTGKQRPSTAELSGTILTLAEKEKDSDHALSKEAK